MLYSKHKMNFHLRKQVLTAVCVYMGLVLVGYHSGWVAPAILKLQDPDQTPLEDVLTDQQSALIGSIVFAGAMFGPFVAGNLANVVGRKPCLLAAGAVSLISCLMLALVKTLIVLYISRVLTGIGTSVIIVLSLVYIGEIASTSIRGILLTIVGLSGSAGILLSYVVGPYITFSASAWLGLGLSGIYIIGICFIPESPVFQVMVGKKAEAAANLILLGRENDIDMVLATALGQQSNSKLKILADMFTIKSNRKALFILVSLLCFQQLSGYYSLLLFATSIFDMAGSNLASHISTMILGATQLVAGCATPFFVENTGRKPLLIVSTAICSLSLTALAIYFYLYNMSHPAAASLQWLSLTSLIVYFIAYTVGLSIIPNALSGEMFTTNVRSIGTSVTLIISWAFGFGISTAYGYMVPAWGAAVTFGIYAGACALALVFTIVFVPETKGKSLLEVQEMLNK